LGQWFYGKTLHMQNKFNRVIKNDWNARAQGKGGGFDLFNRSRQFGVSAGFLNTFSRVQQWRRA
jgi:hypothetical protein